MSIRQVEDEEEQERDNSTLPDQPLEQPDRQTPEEQTLEQHIENGHAKSFYRETEEDNRFYDASEEDTEEGISGRVIGWDIPESPLAEVRNRLDRTNNLDLSGDVEVSRRDGEWVIDYNLLENQPTEHGEMRNYRVKELVKMETSYTSSKGFNDYEVNEQNGQVGVTIKLGDDYDTANIVEAVDTIQGIEDHV